MILDMVDAASGGNLTAIQDQVAQAIGATLPFVIFVTMIALGLSFALPTMRHGLEFRRSRTTRREVAASIAGAWDAIPKDWHRTVETSAALAAALLGFALLFLAGVL